MPGEPSNQVRRAAHSRSAEVGAWLRQDAGGLAAAGIRIYLDDARNGRALAAAPEQINVRAERHGRSVVYGCLKRCEWCVFAGLKSMYIVSRGITRVESSQQRHGLRIYHGRPSGF